MSIAYTALRYLFSTRRWHSQVSFDSRSRSRSQVRATKLVAITSAEDSGQDVTVVADVGDMLRARASHSRWLKVSGLANSLLLLNTYRPSTPDTQYPGSRVERTDAQM
jgi:hypothetical protein